MQIAYIANEERRLLLIVITCGSRTTLYSYLFNFAFQIIAACTIWIYLCKVPHHSPCVVIIVILITIKQTVKESDAGPLCNTHKTEEIDCVLRLRTTFERCDAHLAQIYILFSRRLIQQLFKSINFFSDYVCITSRQNKALILKRKAIEHIVHTCIHTIIISRWLLMLNDALCTLTFNEQIFNRIKSGERKFFFFFFQSVTHKINLSDIDSYMRWTSSSTGN